MDYKGNSFWRLDIRRFCSIKADHFYLPSCGYPFWLRNKTGGYILVSCARRSGSMDSSFAPSRSPNFKRAGWSCPGVNNCVVKCSQKLILFNQVGPRSCDDYLQKLSSMIWNGAVHAPSAKLTKRVLIVRSKGTSSTGPRLAGDVTSFHTQWLATSVIVSAIICFIVKRSLFLSNQCHSVKRLMHSPIDWSVDRKTSIRSLDKRHEAETGLPLLPKQLLDNR